MEVMNTHHLHPITTIEIAWLAGLVEGEGCLSYGRTDRRYPGKANSIRIHVGMSDRDVIERAAAILGTRLLGPYPPSPAHRDGSIRKDQWRVIVTQSLAASWMMTLYPLLGQRRQAAARECLAFWRAYPTTGRMLMPYRLGHVAHGQRHAAPYNLQ
jgi:hypothetical protein